MIGEQLSITEVDEAVAQERLERILLLGQHAMELGME